MIYSSKVKTFEFVDPCLCDAWVATAVIGSAVLGAGAQIYGASKGADAQKEAADRAVGIQREQQAITRADLSPYRAVGDDATNRLTGRLSELTEPISVNPDDFQNSDYYKFLSKEGQRGATNSAAARGLGTSGAALKGAAAFAKGLASTEWQNNFNMKRANTTDAYSRLKGLIDTGANAAAMTGTLGEKSAYNQGTAIVGAGNAEAAASNKIGTSLAGMANNIGGYAMAKGMYGGGGSNITYGGPNGPTPFA